MLHPLHILIVDDDIDKRFVIAHSVAKKFPSASLFECNSGEEALRYLHDNYVDAIVTNHSMAPIDGLTLIRKVRVERTTLPILMVTGHVGVAAAALEAGADRVIEAKPGEDIGAALEELLRNRQKIADSKSDASG